MVDIAAGSAKVGLHVDDDEGGVVRPQRAVPWPGVGIGYDEILYAVWGGIHGCASCLAMRCMMAKRGA